MNEWQLLSPNFKLFAGFFKCKLLLKNNLQRFWIEEIEAD